MVKYMKPPFAKISQSPTNPKAQPEGAKKSFDVANLYDGPIRSLGEAPANELQTALDEKLRQAYFWVINNAIISPFYDIEYHEGPSARIQLGDRKSSIVLPSGQSYSSFILLPILTFAARRKCLLIGGPGRGKTASAILIGLIAGLNIKDVKRGIQKGQPQMTVADLLGNPVPADLISAQNVGDIRISWRKWLGMRIKIIDEYNRIPTRTQSALLTVMSDNYAELFDQIYECPEAAWFLTANDDAGGGTYQVIEALKDRIDVVVKALHFNNRFLSDLLFRIENGINPEACVPPEVIFTEKESDEMYAKILAVKFPPLLRRRLEFFSSHLEFLDTASTQLEYKTKDTAKLSSADFTMLMAQDDGKDMTRELGSQTRNGLSVRALMTSLYFLKAMAFFRGSNEITLEDMRQILPFVFHDKLSPHLESAYFEKKEHETFRVDKVAWLRNFFDQSCAEYERLGLDKDDPVLSMKEIFDQGLDGISEIEAKRRMSEIEALLGKWSKGGKFYSHMFDDVLTLKYLHQRYTNYLRWLTWT